VNQIDLDALLHRFQKKWATNLSYALTAFTLARFQGFLWLLPGWRWVPIVLTGLWFGWMVVSCLTIWLDVKSGRDWDDHIDPGAFFLGLMVGALIVMGVGLEFYRES
jgi:hypothetical protein